MIEDLMTPILKAGVIQDLSTYVPGGFSKGWLTIWNEGPESVVGTSFRATTRDAPIFLLQDRMFDTKLRVSARPAILQLATQGECRHITYSLRLRWEYDP